MSSDWISPSSWPPESCSARLSACSSSVSGSRPAAISFGRSTISPTPTMTGMRSSGTGEGLFDILASLSGSECAVALRGLRFATAPQGDGYRHGVILRCERLRASKDDEVFTLAANTLLRHQRIHVLDRLDEFFLEFLHHRACGFHAVDQAHALADKIADEVARLGVAGRRRAIDRGEGVAADDALQRHRQRAGAVGSAVPGIRPDRAQLPRRFSS